MLKSQQGLSSVLKAKYEVMCSSVSDQSSIINQLLTNHVRALTTEPLPPACTGARTVVHPKARIIAEAGPIIIGEGNLIEEQALIINRYAAYHLRHIKDMTFDLTRISCTCNLHYK